MPITVPSGVAVTLKRMDDGRKHIEVSGSKGSLTFELADGVDATVTDSVLAVEVENDSRRGRAIHGLTRALLANMVHGVSTGFEKTLEIHGLGYKAKLDGSNLVLALGFCHPITYPIPDGIELELATDVLIRVKGVDKQKVGQVAADIRGFRKPEPYKGKGIRYKGEYVRRKQGKTGV